MAALRQALAALPEADSPLRCRVMLSLALEIYYGTGHDERSALVRRGTGDGGAHRRPASSASTRFQLAFVALWRSRTAPRRLQLGERGRCGSRTSSATSAPTSSPRPCARSCRGSSGCRARCGSALAVARDAAGRQRLPYGLIVLDSMELPWLAMAGKFEECEERMVNIRLLDQRMSLHQTDDATLGALMAMRLWQGRAGEMAEMLRAAQAGSGLPARGGGRDVHAAWRPGGPREGVCREPPHRPRRRRLVLHAHVVQRGGGRRCSWATVTSATRAYARLAPFEGYSCCAGVGPRARPGRRVPRPGGRSRWRAGRRPSARRRRPRAVRGMAGPAGRAVVARPAGHGLGF